ncbi:alpha/beta hydrolase [Pseudonocardia sp. T1-2H]|uniref:alpha/beta hydrolase n=1 Tax=Pseudonocardia sp. T1-2H TaxID=3128899 RepID=UPI0031017593
MEATLPVHPEAQALLGALAEAGMPPFPQMTVPGARAATKGFLDLQGEPEPIAVDNRRIDGPASQIPVRVYTPDGAGPKPLIVYYHGGGWVIGDLEIVDRPLRTIANRTGAVIVSVDYRLAPEHVAPAAFDDCYAATEWAAAHAAELGADPARLIVAGDSAGGHLAASVAQAATDRGGPAIAAQLLLFPATDFDFSTPSYEENADGYLLTRGSMEWFWAHYLGAQNVDIDYLTPGRREDLAGLPPAFVATAEYDPLRDEGEAYARKLEAAGVAVTAKRYDGMLHDFLWTLGATPSGAVIIDDIAAAVTAAVGR